MVVEFQFSLKEEFSAFVERGYLAEILDFCFTKVVSPALWVGNLVLGVKGGVASPLPRVGFNDPPAEK